MKKTLLCIGFYLVSVVFAWAQTGEPAAVLIYSEGESFLISRGDEVIEYDLYLDDVEGFEFYKGDFINTGNGTFLEIQLYPTENVLKISENTSFTIAGSGSGGGGGEFAITYGRVRAKVQKLTGNDTFSIRGPSVVAGVRGTDFGYDFIAGTGESQGTALARVYCFEGKVEVSRLEQKEEVVDEEVIVKSVVVETVVIEANQMVTILPEESAVPLSPKALTEEVKTFWDTNEFRGEIISYEPEPEVKVVEAPEPVEVPEIIPEEPVPDKRRQVRKSIIASGAGFSVVGTVIGGVGGAIMYFGDDIVTGKTLLITGSGVLGAGLITMIIGLFVGR